MYKKVHNTIKSLIFGFLFILSTSVAFADTHAFKYTPTDEGNTTATVVNFSTANDSNGKSYWYRTGGSNFEQSLATSWTTNSYVYVFYESTSNWLYNQSYIYGTSTYTNLSFFSGTGHDPDKISTFTVDGRNISMYRYYTKPNTLLNNSSFQASLIISANGVNGTRVYGLVPSDSFTAPPVTDEASMYDYLGTFFNPTTHIISFTPENNTVYSSSSPVNFSLNAYISPDDVGIIAGVRIIFHNIDQNVLLSSLSTNDIEFYNAIATTSGVFSFSSSTMLEAGNYRIEAQLDRSLAWGILRNPFSSVNETQSHQFIVGTSTFIGNISQNSFNEINNIYSSFSATSTANLSSSCNVLSGFDTLRCVAFLFIPSNEQLYDTMNNFKSGFLERSPWGYFTRMYEIWNTTATSSLPTATVKISMGNATDYESVSVDFGDMLVGGVAQLNSITSPREGKTIRDVLELPVQLLIALAVLYTILTDLAGSHRHNSSSKHTT